MNTGTPSDDLDALVSAVCLRVPPLWGLRDLVAVNPFLGYAGGDLLAAEDALQRRLHAVVLPPWSRLRQAWLAGGFTRDDLAAAWAESGDHEMPVERLVALLADDHPVPEPVRCLSIAARLSEPGGRDWLGVVVDDLGRFLAARTDRGVGRWALPGAGGLWADWRVWMRHDRSLELHGLAGVRVWLAQLPADAQVATRRMLARLGLDGPGADDYLGRLLGEVPGWAGWLRQEAWRHDQQAVGELPELLAMRLALDLALHDLHPRRGVRPSLPAGTPAAMVHDRRARLVAVAAWERAVRHELVAGFRPVRVVPTRPVIQAVFCIDVRSEGLRRQLEGADSGIATYGFAGFFAMPVALRDAVAERAQCPVLLRPGVRLDLARPAAGAVRRLLASFRRSAGGGFAYMETAGLAAAAGLVAGSLGRAGHDRGDDETMRVDDGAIEAGQRLALLRGLLANLGLSRPHARVVLFCGHDSTVTNNPQAAALACGACGGHSGAINARLAARLYNDPGLRRQLGPDAPPSDSLAVAGVHDTATDAVRLLDADALPASHAEDLACLRRSLAMAGARQRDRRAAELPGSTAGLGDAARLADAMARSRDWAELRPEWGLAGNAAFIAGPRQLTAGRDLRGRCFLHSYDETRDPEGSVLSLILTAPVVVASWINLQYWASSVDPTVFGSGTKTIHSIVGGIGVAAGGSGDLLQGLALESVDDGRRPRHQPLRLQVFVAAGTQRIDAVVAGHGHLRDLVEHGWIVLHAIDVRTAGCLRRRPGGAWLPVLPAHAAAG